MRRYTPMRGERYVVGPFSTVAKAEFITGTARAWLAPWTILFLEDGTTAEGADFADAQKAKWLQGLVDEALVPETPVDL